MKKELLSIGKRAILPMIVVFFLVIGGFENGFLVQNARGVKVEGYIVSPQWSHPHMYWYYGIIGGWTLGYRFVVNQDITVDELGFYRDWCPNYVSNIRLWTEGGAPIAEYPNPSPLPNGNWEYWSISPIALPAGIYSISLFLNGPGFYWNYMTAVYYVQPTPDGVIVPTNAVWIEGNSFPSNLEPGDRPLPMLDFHYMYDYIDTTPPETTITLAFDGYGEIMTDGGSTLSDTMMIAFTGSDDIQVDHFEQSIDGGSWLPISGSWSKSGLSSGSHTFMVRAIDTSGNVDPTPATFTWTILEPPEAIVELIADIDGMPIDQPVKNGLTSKLNDAKCVLLDGNPNNDHVACNKLDDFINQVNAKENSGKLTPEQADQLRQSAEKIKTALGCP